MRAITIQPRSGLPARLDDIPEPNPLEGPVLAETIAVGICGTDREILDGTYGTAPAGRDRLVLGHEALATIVDAPSDSGLKAGDLIVPIVRHPDPVPCDHCAVGEWDMCRNGRYTEHGINGRDGFARERFRTLVSHAVRIDPALGIAGVLLEPASIVAKAWAHIERIGARSRWTPRRVLVLGAGPVGLLAALLGVERRLDVHVLDRVMSGPKPALVQQLGATYHTGDVGDACEDVDIVLECTGAPQLVFDAMRCVSPAGIVCLTGVSSGARIINVDASALNNELVLDNTVVFGSVNANRLHYERAASALAAANPDWLHGMITRQVPLSRWQDAFAPDGPGVKTILRFGDALAD